MSVHENLSSGALLALLPEAQRKEVLDGLTDAQHEELLWDWLFWARPAQKEPPGDWLTWLILTGRGWGKTRTGAEWIRNEVTSKRSGRIALIGETQKDLEEVMVFGESGIHSVFPPHQKPKITKKPIRIVFHTGAVAHGYNATEPDQLRGPQFDAAWCDELAKWQYARDTFDMLQFGLRLGERPRQIITTTPRPVPVIKELLARAMGDNPEVVITRGATSENSANLAVSFLRQVERRYAGTRLGRQELEGELLEDVAGALWSRAQLDELRVKPTDVPDLTRVIVAIDPGATSGEDADESGIICAGVGTDGHGYVLEDQSGIYKPIEWAREAIALHKARKGDRIIAEVNNGGEMVETTLRIVDPNVAYTAIHASRGKVMRSEPISALYEQGKVHHVGSFGQLEDQMCAFTPDFDRSTAGYSPDRLDALVWALSELMVHDGAPAIPAEERDFLCEPIEISESWPRVFTIDVSIDRVAVLWGALNKQDDTLYLTAEYAASRTDFAVHAAAIRSRSKWVPGVIAPRAHGRAMVEGAALVERLTDLELELSTVICDEEAALGLVTQRIGTKRLRVFRTLTDWLAEYRAYRRNTSGKLGTERNELMNATALLCAAGIDAAIVKPKKRAPVNGTQRSAWGV